MTHVVPSSFIVLQICMGKVRAERGIRDLINQFAFRKGS